MAQVFLYPATGESPLDEDGNPFPSTGLRVTMNAYYEGQCRQGLLVRQDPSAFSSVAQPAVYAPVTLGYVTTQLSGLAGQRDGQYVTTIGYSQNGDGGGYTFRFSLGVSSGADGYIKINCSNGQWENLGPRELGFMRPEWLGAKGDNATDDTAAIQLAVDTGLAMSPPVRALELGAKTYLIRTTSSSGLHVDVLDNFGYSFRGQGVRVTTIRLGSNVSDGSGPVDGGAGYGLWFEGLELDVRGFKVLCNDFADPRQSWGVDPTNIPTRVHGIVFGGYRSTFADLEIEGVSGAGFRGYGQSFQVQLTHVNATDCGTSDFHIQGNNTWKLDNCGAGACGWGHPCIYVPDGQLCIDTLNSVIGPSNYPGLPNNGIPPDLVIIEHGGLLTVRNTNFEEFTKWAVYTTGDTAPVFDNCTWYTAVGGFRRTGTSSMTATAVRAWVGEFVSYPALFGNTNKLFDPSAGGWGRFDTGVVDGAYFQIASGSLPFFYIGRSRGDVWVTSLSALYTGSLLRYAASTLGEVGAHFSALVVTDIAYTRQVLAAGSHAAICGDNEGNTAGGDVTVTLPDPLTTPGRVFWFVKTAAANNYIIAYGGGISDGTTGTAPVTITLTGIYDALAVRAIGTSYFVISRSV